MWKWKCQLTIKSIITPFFFVWTRMILIYIYIYIYIYFLSMYSTHPLCPTCKRNYESIFHILWLCSSSVQFGRKANAGFKSSPLKTVMDGV